MSAEDTLYRWGLTISKFRDMPDDANFAAVATACGVAKLTYGDARAMLKNLLDAQDRLGRIADWHARETGPAGTVGDLCTECGQRWPCETRRMADGTYSDEERTDDQS